MTAPTASAPAPSRATGSLTLGFGLVSIPVAVFAGTQDGGIQRHEFTELSSPIAGEPNTFVKVGRQSVYTDDAGVACPVDSSKVVKMYETQSGAKVLLSDGEIAAAVGEMNGSGKIVNFQPLANLGAYVTESVMQVRPAKRGSGRDKTVDPVAQRAFALLTTAMREEGTFGMVRYVMRGKVRYGALTADGNLYALRFAGEVRAPLDLPEVELSAPERAAAKLLVNSVRQESIDVLTDDASERVDAYATSKATTGAVAVEAPEAAAHADFAGLMAALVKSVEAAGGKTTEVA